MRTRSLNIKKLNYRSLQNIVLALFLVSGPIKFIFKFYEFPIDITLLLSALIIGDIILSFSRGIKSMTKKDFVYLFFFFSLLAISILSLTYSPSDSYKYVKALSYSTTTLAFCYPLFIIEFNEKVFFKTILITIIPSSIAFLIAKNIYWYGSDPLMQFKYRYFGGSYLLLADCIVFSTFFLIQQKKHLFAILLILLIFAMGAKGPFLFLIFIILIWKQKQILNYKVRKKALNYLGIGLLVIMPICVIYSQKILSIFKVGFYRFANIFSNSYIAEDDHTRLEYFGFALEGIFNNPLSFLFGNGLGSYGLMLNGVDEKDFPHNIFLEAWFELGIAGLVIVIILLVFPLLFKHKSMIIKLCATYIFLNYLKSGTLDGPRILFIIYGLLLFLKEPPRHEV